MTAQSPPPGYPPPPPSRQQPNKHLALAILALIFCFVLGLVAIVKSSQVSGLWAQGRYVEAQDFAGGARTWAIWSIVVGAVAYVGCGIWWWMW
jgi:hypothetical protein